MQLDKLLHGGDYNPVQPLVRGIISMAEIITRSSGWTARIFWPKMWN